MIVADTSTAVASLLDDEFGAAAEAILRRVVIEGALVPSLWRLEVANVLRNAVRRGRCDEDHVGRSLARLADLAITVDPETDQHAWGATLTLAREEQLTVYDAAYLELAMRRCQPLASFDARLVQAAGRRQVEVLGASG